MVSFQVQGNRIYLRKTKPIYTIHFLTKVHSFLRVFIDVPVIA